MKCVIFCAGGFESLAEPIEKEDYIIAADGGYRHTQRMGLSPRLILGDFDSLGFVPESGVVHPVEKDDTDAMLAVRQGLKAGFRDFRLYGSLDGPRLDHTVANFQTLQYLADRGARGFLIGNRQIVTVVKNGVLEFEPGCRGDISVFAQGGHCRGVSIRGLYYTLEAGDLSCGFPLGVSNHFTEAGARICVEEGSLLVIFDRGNPLPRHRLEGEKC